MFIIMPIVIMTILLRMTPMLMILHTVNTFQESLQLMVSQMEIKNMSLVLLLKLN